MKNINYTVSKLKNELEKMAKVYSQCSCKLDSPESVGINFLPKEHELIRLIQLGIPDVSVMA